MTTCIAMGIRRARTRGFMREPSNAGSGSCHQVVRIVEPEFSPLPVRVRPVLEPPSTGGQDWKNSPVWPG